MTELSDAVRALFDTHKYRGQPYPLRTDRVVFLVKPERAQAQNYG
jgi:hypothetical protein